jgi:hypothetical protein
MNRTSSFVSYRGLAQLAMSAAHDGHECDTAAGSLLSRVSQSCTRFRIGKSGDCADLCTLSPIAPPAEWAYARHRWVFFSPWCFVENELAVPAMSLEAPKPSKTKRSRWLWPVGLVATGLAGAAVLFRGCWHRRMSWPVRSGGQSYQVCLGCGAKRLFDEDAFQSYGPYSYELQRLVAWDRERRSENEAQAAGAAHRSAS